MVSSAGCNLPRPGVSSIDIMRIHYDFVFFFCGSSSTLAIVLACFDSLEQIGRAHAATVDELLASARIDFVSVPVNIGRTKRQIKK